MVRTRFAPSPTGYLHIGGARTALFCWAYAKKHGGIFILRVEDTDLERSTQQSVQAILDGMQWLGMASDEGPFYQMKRLHRYQEVARQLLDAGHAYHCYCSKEELDAMREAQRARGEKPRYDGRWRDSKEKPPAGVTPVLRFKTPLDGDVTWNDEVKGPITINNQELDDLVILRGDGVPTYNFGVVVDDIDMNITHVIRGDDHVNNTPRQINIFKALGKILPKFAHLPMILGSDGERLSKRHGAVGVMQYRDEGYLPEALVNYLARLGWSHGNAEKFTREQLIEWFDLAHVSKSTARFDMEKLAWLNQQYIKEADNQRLAALTQPFLEKMNCSVEKGPKLVDVVGLLKSRVKTIVELANAAEPFYKYVQPTDELRIVHYTPEAMTTSIAVTKSFVMIDSTDWTREKISHALKDVAKVRSVKMPAIAMPLRVMVAGKVDTPSIDATLELIGREEVLRRMEVERKKAEELGKLDK